MFRKFLLTLPIILYGFGVSIAFADPFSGAPITYNGGGGGTGGGGTGNVTGPSSSTDGDVVLFSGTTGKIIQDPGYGPTMTIAGTSVNLGGSITSSTILDNVGSTRGSILYRGAAGWSALTPGTSGFYLKTNGAGADPSWATVSGSGTVTSVACGNGLTCSTAPITTTGTISTSVTLNTQTVASYATLSTDGGKVVTLANAGAIAVSLSQANTAGFTSGFGTTYANLNASGGSNVTITATTSTFGNASTSLVVLPGQVVDIASDSINYPFTAVSLPLTPVDNIIGNFTGSANYPRFTALPSCSSANQFLQYNTSTHALSCGTATSSSSSNWVASNWYNAFNSPVNSGVNISATVTQWVPVYFDKPVTIGNIGARISASSAGGNMQFAVYASGSNGLPTGSALCTTASISTASTGSFDAACSATGSGALASAGRYWFGYQVDNATATVVSSTGAIAINSVIGASSHTNLSGSATNFGTEYKTTGGTYGTWPTNPTITQAGTSGNSVPMIQFSLSSVP